jgi:hypothetical protein
MSLLPISIFRNRPTTSLFPTNVSLYLPNNGVEITPSWSGAPAANSFNILIYQSDYSPVTTSGTLALSRTNVTSGVTINTFIGGGYYAAVVIARYTSAISNSQYIAAPPAPAAPTNVSIPTTPTTQNCQVSWTAPASTPLSYTVRIYQASSASVTTSSTLLVTQTSASSGNGISCSATNGYYLAATVTSVYSGSSYTSSISASRQVVAQGGGGN